jgi:hypothetical protein
MRVNGRPQPRAEKSTKVLRIRACRNRNGVAPQEGALVAGYARALENFSINGGCIMRKEQKKENSFGVQIVGTFAEEVGNHFSLSDLLYLNVSSFGIFRSVHQHSALEITDPANKFAKPREDIIVGDAFREIDTIRENFDYIIGDLPFGLKTIEWVDETKEVRLKERKNWIILLKSLFLLKDGGYGLYAIEPVFWSLQGEKFIKALNDKGFFVNAAFNTPENILLPETALQPNIILISREKNEDLFIAELTDENKISVLIKNFSCGTGTTHLEEGIFIKQSDFKGFSNYKIKKQLEILKSQYKEYQGYKLIDISKEIQLGNQKKKFEDKANSIYIDALPLIL